MRHWVTRIFVLLFAAVWFGVVVPGHQRGAISFPGSAVSTADLPPCHQKKLPKSPTSPAKPAQCVICTLAAMTSPPPAIEAVPELSYRESLVVPAPEVSFALHIPLPFSERGPPAA